MPVSMHPVRRARLGKDASCKLPRNRVPGAPDSVVPCMNGSRTEAGDVLADTEIGGRNGLSHHQENHGLMSIAEPIPGFGAIREGHGLKTCDKQRRRPLTSELTG